MRYHDLNDTDIRNALAWWKRGDRPVFVIDTALGDTFVRPSRDWMDDDERILMEEQELEERIIYRSQA